MLRLLTYLALLAPALGACRAPGPEAAPSSATAPRLSASEAVEQMSPRERHDRLVDYFPNIELVTQDGERVRFYDDLIFERVVLINFMYTSCEGT